MTPPLAPLIDPDLEQVLEDLGKLKRTTLFAFDHRKLLYGLRDGSIQARSTQAGLLPVERHLLDVHRYEVAWLLREAFLREYFSKPFGKGVVYRRPVLDASAWAARASRQIAVDGESSGEALRGLLQGQTPIGLHLILAQSLRLEDAPKARAYEVLLLKNTGQRHTALSLARRLAVAGSPVQALGSALQSIAFIHEESGLVTKAAGLYWDVYELYMRYDLGPHFVCLPLCNVLHLALMENAEAVALRAAKHLDETVPPQHASIGVAARAISGHDQPGPLRSALLRRVIDRSGSSTREFIDAFR